jgi:hypothetical protein
MYIIVWRNGHRDPFVDVDSNDFLETYSTYEEAEKSAKANQDNEHYHDWKIYEEATQ